MPRSRSNAGQRRLRARDGRNLAARQFVQSDGVDGIECVRRSADGAGGWEGQVWDTVLNVPMTTLDALIEAYGVPAFVKIDVEGFEADVLAV